MFAKKLLYALACLSLGTVLLISLSTAAQAVPASSIPPPPRSASSSPPPGYEGALDHLRPVFPIWRPPLADPVGLALNAAGTRAYVIEKGLHRLSWVDLDPASPTHTAVTPVTDALNDPQMAVALDAAETHALVVENAPGTLKRVTLSSGLVATVTASLDHPLDVALSLDETTAYVTQFGGALVAVDLSNGGVTTVTAGLEYPGGIALSPDGSTAYVAELCDGPLRQVKLSTGAISDVGTSFVMEAWDLAVDAAGTYAYLADHKAHLVRVDLSSGDTDVLIPSTGDRAEAVALSPDGKTLYATQRATGRLLRIDPVAGTAESVFPLLQWPSAVTLNQAGTRLYVLEDASGELSVQDVDPASPTFGALATVATGVVPPSGFRPPPRLSVAVNAAETWALVPQESDLRRVDLASGAVSTVVSDTFNGATGVALNRAGTVAYVGDGEGIWKVDTANRAVTPAASVPHGAHALALSPDETCLYAVHLDINRYDLAPLVRVRLSDGQVTDIPADVAMPVGLALTPDGERAIVSDYARGGRVVDVDLDTGATTLLANLPTWAPTKWCQPGGVALGPDGTAYVASANWADDGFTDAGVVYGVRPGAVWRLAVLAESSLHCPEDGAISADGNWLYVLAGDGLHRVGLAPGAAHGQITPVGDGAIWDARGLALTPDGVAWVVSGGSLHKVSLADGALLATIDYGGVTGANAEYGVALSPDETLAYLGTKDSQLAQVDLDTGAVEVIATGLAAPYGAAVNAAGDTVYVAEADAGRLVAVDVDTGHVSTVTADLERPTDVALDEPNAAIVLENPPPSPTYDFASYISRVDLTTGVVTRVFSGQIQAAGLALTPDHARAYFTRLNGDIWGVDLATGLVADSLVEALNRPHGFALAGGGQGAYTTEEYVPRIRHVDLSTSQVRTAVHLAGAASGLALTQDETTAYVTRMYYDDLLEVDLQAGTSITVAEGCLHGRVALDPTETTAYVSCYGGGSIWAVDLTDGSRSELAGDLPAPYAMDIDQAGTLLYTTVGAVGEPGDLQLLAIEIPTGTVTSVAIVEEGQDAPGDITLSPDERYVYVYDQAGSRIGAGIWRVDVDPGSPAYGQVVALGRWIGELQHGEFTADGKYLILSNAGYRQMLSLCPGEGCIPPQADFTAAPTSGVAPLTVSFTNNSTGEYADSRWGFGDGVTSTLGNPTHIYRTAGVYTVTLTVSGPGGSDTEEKAGYIGVQCGVYLPLILRDR